MQITSNKRALCAAVASAMILAGGLSGCGKNQSAETLIAEARQFQAKGDSKAAVIQLKNAVSKDPQDPEARFLLASIYNDLGDATSAEKEIRKAISLGLARERALPVLAKALLALREYQKVLDETGAPNAAKTAELLTVRGDAHLALQQGDLAKAAYDGALIAQPNYPLALIGLARHAFTRSDATAAAAFAEQAVKANATSADAWLFKADVLRSEGKMDEALVAYDKVLAIKPDHRSAHIEKAYLHIGASKFDLAKTEIAAAKKATPGSLLVTYTEALLDFTQGNNAAALESLQKVLRVAPDHLPSVLLAGAVQFKLGSMPQAEQHLKKYLEAVPQNLYARKLMVGTLLRLGRTAEASEMIAPVLAANGNDAQLMAMAGEAAMQSRDYPKATEYLQKASALAPKMADVRTSLAMSKLAQGDEARAIAELETAAALDTTSSKAGMLLVMTEMRLKHADKALAAATALVKALPQDPLVHNLKGGVYLSMNDVPNARLSFEKALALQPTFFPAASNLADIAVRDKKPEVARQIFTTLLEKDKKNAQAMTALAALAAAEKKPAEVTSWLEKAQSENAEALAPALQLIKHYLATGQKEKALTLARKFQVANASNADLLDALGQAQMLSDDKNGALDSYSKLVALAPKSPVAHLRLAGIHLALNNPAAAGDDLKKAVALQPNMIEAQGTQIELAARAGKFADALAIARTIQTQRPKEPIGHVLEGDLHLADKKPALALAAYEKAYAIAKSPPLMVKLASTMKLVGKEKEAAVRLAQWQKDYPADAIVPLFVAENHIGNRQYKPAIALLEALLKQYPTSVPALNNLAWVYQEEKDPRALETAEKAYKLAPTSAAVMDTLGWVLLEKGDVARAQPLLKKAVDLMPAADDIRFHWAAGLAKSGDKAGAKKELEKLVSSGRPFTTLEQAKSLLKTL